MNNNADSSEFRLATTQEDLSFALSEIRSNSRMLFHEKMEELRAIGLDNDETALLLIEKQVEDSYFLAKRRVEKGFADGVMKIRKPIK